MALRNYNIYKTPPTLHSVKEPYPEIYNENRDLIPDETFVLVGLCKSEAHYQWIKNNMLYNIGLGSRNNPIPITKEMINSRFLLLFSLEQDTSLHLWKISQNNTETYSRQDLLDLNYPTSTHHSYLVFQLQQVTEPELKDISVKFSKLKFDVNKHPLVITLAEVVKYKKTGWLID
ncbi:MAG: hypothetical protein M0Q12_07085 [Synergistaceae bacterium]|jgi:hypothetical protein|nr:hypothetical protein [Synergistaceae bacterium]